MSDDLIERLRVRVWTLLPNEHPHDAERREAADELERLQQEVNDWVGVAAMLNDEIQRLREAFNQATLDMTHELVRATVAEAELERLQAENNLVWCHVAVALMAEIADQYYDPNSVATQAYNHARNCRYAEAGQLLALAERDNPT